MGSVAWSFFGACVALTIRFFVDRYERIKKKRENCLHLRCRIVKGPYGYKTKFCDECGWQEAYKEDE